jgi:hypothetical protein
MDAGLTSGGTVVPVYELKFTGTFNADGSAVTNSEVTGLIDSRPVSDSLGMDICDLLPIYGDSCVACPDGEIACIALDVQDRSSPLEAGLVIDPAIDPSTDPHCN